jgi:RHS repeat-associated protein
VQRIEHHDIVVQKVRGTQDKTDTFSYWPYGESKNRADSTPTPFQFVGTLGYYADSSFFTYVRARYFRQGLGFWLTEDPNGFEGGEWNLSSYASEAPTARTDPSGRAVTMQQIAKPQDPCAKNKSKPIPVNCQDCCDDKLIGSLLKVAKGGCKEVIACIHNCESDPDPSGRTECIRGCIGTKFGPGTAIKARNFLTCCYAACDAPGSKFKPPGPCCRYLP